MLVIHKTVNSHTLFLKWGNLKTYYIDKLNIDKSDDSLEFKKRDYILKSNSIIFNGNKNLDYPYLTKINFIKLNENINLENKRKELSKETSCRMTEDYIEGKPDKKLKEIKENKNKRLASPVYYTFTKFYSGTYFILSEINYSYVANENEIDSKKYIDKFVKNLIEISER